MKLSANEIRSFLRDRATPLSPGQFLSDVPVVSIGDARFQQAIRTFCIKLLCALYYKHTGIAVPSDAEVCGRWLSNVQVIEDGLPDELFQTAGTRVPLRRAANDLQEQFNYSFGIAIEKTVSVFFCTFRQSFALIGFVSFGHELGEAYDEDLVAGIFWGKTL